MILVYTLIKVSLGWMLLLIRYKDDASTDDPINTYMCVPWINDLIRCAPSDKPM